MMMLMITMIVTDLFAFFAFCAFFGLFALLTTTRGHQFVVLNSLAFNELFADSELRPTNRGQRVDSGDDDDDDDSCLDCTRASCHAQRWKRRSKAHKQNTSLDLHDAAGEMRKTNDTHDVAFHRCGHWQWRIALSAGNWLLRLELPLRGSSQQVRTTKGSLPLRHL